MPLDLQSGQQVSVELNGNGVDVRGHVALRGKTRSKIELNYSLNYLIALREGITPLKGVARVGLNWRNGWTDVFTTNLEGIAYRKTLHHHFVKLGRDGTFNISGVRPGRYELAFKVYEPPIKGCLVQPVAIRKIKFEVSDKHRKNGLELGSITVDAFQHAVVGDKAPELTFESLDGSRQKLSGLRGKYVLIDTWATWCGPCIASLPKMKKLHARFAPRGLVVLGMNLDRDKAKARKFVRDRKLPWKHGFLGQWSKSDFPRKYGITSVPYYVIVDPHGRVIHRGTQEHKMVEFLEKVLP